MNVPRLALLFLLGSLSGCGTPSNDPREGGLFGYWATGQQGYQDRLDGKRQAYETEQQAGQTARMESVRLTGVRDARQAELDRQNAELASLAQESATLESQLASARAAGERKAAEKSRLAAEIAQLRQEVESTRSNGTQEEARTETRIAELKNELKALRQKASLLLSQ